MSSDLLITTEHGLYCPAGDFYIDPWRPRPGSRAVITHAHSDHLRAGASEYLASLPGALLIRARIGSAATITPQPWGEAHAVTLNDTRVSLHPAGHVLGSAMVRVEYTGAGSAHPRGETWVVSGDYKLARDGISEAWEPVRCHTFITESTFGLPVYRWRPQAELFAEVDAWWRANQAEGLTSIIFAYSLGKAQRVLANIDASIGPIFAHGAVMNMNAAYALAGAALPAVAHAKKEAVRAAARDGRAALVVAPPGADDSPWARALGPANAAVASGWMMIRGSRRRQNVQRGFAISDHADWPALNEAIRLSGAARIGVTHGFVAPMVRWLREGGQGLDAFPVATRYEGEAGEDSGGKGSPDTDAAAAAVAADDMFAEPKPPSAAPSSSSPPTAAP
ncbi:ligase-associated DNA damage response exonuclease [soil metagenome]